MNVFEGHSVGKRNFAAVVLKGPIAGVWTSL